MKSESKTLPEKKHTQVKYRYLKKRINSWKVFVLRYISVEPAEHSASLAEEKVASKELLKDYTAHKQQELANTFSRALSPIQRDDVP